MRPLKLAVPNKGRLSDDTLQVLRRAGIHLRGSSERRLFATALDGRIQVLFLRANDIPAFVADGAVDAGITGLDVTLESGLDLHVRTDLGFGKCRLVVAVPERSQWTSPADLPDGVRIATSFPNLTETYFRDLGKRVRIIPVSGACEVTPTIGVADAITDLTSSGSTLVMNHLREVGTIATSTCHLVTASHVDPEVRENLERIVFALESVIDARDQRYLLADLPRASLDAVRAFLPGLAGPTVVEIAGDPEMVAIQVVVQEDQIFDAVHQLRALGGRGILVVPIDRMVA